MLSKTAVIILGILSRQSLNAYGMIRLLAQLNITDWYYIADSTVYTTIRNLEKRNWISGTLQKNRNLPDKTIYTLLPSGKEELVKSLSEYIMQFQYDVVPYLIAGFFITALKKEQAIELLEKRVLILEKYLQAIRDKVAYIKKTNIPNIAISNTESGIYYMEAQLKGTSQMLKAVKETQNWGGL